MPLYLSSGTLIVTCPTCGQDVTFNKEIVDEGWNILTCKLTNGGCNIPLAVRISVDLNVSAYSVKTPEFDHREEIFGDAKKPEKCPECGSRKICRVDDVSRGDFKYDCLSCGLFFGDRVDMTQPLKPETDDAIEEIRDLEKLREENDPDVN